MHFLVKNRVRQRMEWLKGLASAPLAQMEKLEWCVVPEYLPFAQAQQLAFEPFSVGSDWGEDKKRTKAYFRLTFSLPKEAKGAKAILRVKPNGEGLCYRPEGVPWQGLDWARSDILLAAPAKGGESYTLLLEVTTQRRVKFEQCEVVRENPALAQAAYLADMCFQLAEVTGEPQPARGQHRNLFGDDGFRADQIWKALDTALNAFPWGNNDPAANEAAAQNTIKVCTKLLKQRGAEGRLTFDLMANSHIDTAWLWPLSETVRKCARTFSTVLNYMKAYPAYRYIQSQPQLYRFVEEHYPALFAQIKERVAEGRWDPTGAMWVESDTNVPSGESLVRQILLGNGYFQKHFGVRTRILWLPDVFGYSAALPQILSRAGVPYFFTAKLGVNEYNRFPLSWFQWEGIDGTRVVAHVQLAGYGGNLTPHHLHYVEQQRTSPETDSTTMLFGHGDGGGGPTEEHMKGLTLFGDTAGLPRTRIRPVEAIFDENAAKDLPAWHGELYFENHRGTYTTLAKVKRLNRQCELALHDAEMLAAWEILRGGKVSAKTFAPLWESTCLHQFHDILPGSSISLVYEEAVPTMTGTRDAARQLANESLARLTKSAPGRVAVANTLSWERTDVINLPEDYRGSLATQKIVNGKLALVNTPGLGLFSAYPAKATGLQADKLTLSNQWVKAVFNPKGQLVSLFDLEHNREALKAGQVGNELRLHEDRPGPSHYGGGNDAWDISDYSETKYRTLEAARAELIETGPVRATIRFTYTWECGEIVQDASLYAHSRRVEFRTHVVWNEDQRMLRAHLPVAINSDQATYEIQFGHLHRPTHRNTSWEQAQFEVCGHKWADLSEGDFGVALLNDCKYGYSAHGSHLSIDLLRATTSPDPTADRGEHDFIYAVLAHGKGLLEVVREAYALNIPLLAMADRAPASDLKIDVSAEHVVLETMKPAEDGRGVIMRCYDALNARGPVEVTIPGITAAAETNLVEQNEGRLAVEKGKIAFDIKPFEVKTFRVAKRVN
jgi:alpha-mannosidase